MAAFGPPGYQCSHCGRSFGDDAFQTHVPHDCTGRVISVSKTQQRPKKDGRAANGKPEK